MKVSGPHRAYLIRTIDLFDPSLLQLPLRKHHARVSARRSESWHSAAFAPSSSPAAPRHVALLGTRGPSRPRPPLTVPPARPACVLESPRAAIQHHHFSSICSLRCVEAAQGRRRPSLCASSITPVFYILGFECTFMQQSHSSLCCCLFSLLSFKALSRLMA